VFLTVLTVPALDPTALQADPFPVEPRSDLEAS
jgi:hypothetical protein